MTGGSHLSAHQAARDTVGWVRGVVEHRRPAAGWVLARGGRTVVVDVAGTPGTPDPRGWGMALAHARLRADGRPQLLVAATDRPGPDGFGHVLVLVAAAGGGLFGHRMPYRTVPAGHRPTFTWLAASDRPGADELSGVFAAVLPTLVRVGHPSGALPKP